MNATPLHEDDDPWALCVVEHSGALLGYARMLVGSSEAGADLLQDALVSVIRSGACPAQPRAYLMQTMRRRAQELARRRHAEPTHAAVPLVEVGVDPPEEGHPMSDRLWPAVAALPSAQREVVLLHTRAGLAFREIAEVLQQPIGTVTSHYSRGLKRLRAALAGISEASHG